MSRFICNTLLFLSLSLFLVPISIALTDPTTPLDFERKKSESTYILQTILIGEKRKLAVINGQRLQEQEIIISSGGVKVISISHHRVELEKNGNRWTLNLRKKNLVRK